MPGWFFAMFKYFVGEPLKFFILTILALNLVVSSANAGACFNFYQRGAEFRGDLPDFLKFELITQKETINSYLNGSINSEEMGKLAFSSLGRLKTLIKNYLNRDLDLKNFHSVDIEKRNREVETILLAIEIWYRETSFEFSSNQLVDNRQIWNHAGITKRALTYFPRLNRSPLATSRRYLEVFDQNHKGLFGSENFETAKYWIHTILTEGSQRMLSELRIKYYNDVATLQRVIVKPKY